jgi:hypothetical protein
MAKRYDLKAVDLIIAGLRITGFGENAAIEFEEERDLGEITVGADGAAIFSSLNSKTLFVTITLLESTVGYTTLAGIMQAQIANHDLGLPTLPIAFLMTDRLNGDSVASVDTFFVQRPVASKGRTVGERVFRLVLPDANRTYGILNVI